jgi:hypothetical protein
LLIEIWKLPAYPGRRMSAWKLGEVLESIQPKEIEGVRRPPGVSDKALQLAAPPKNAR